MTDSEKLRALATWFDIHDAMKGNQLFDNEVQIDLRAMADRIEQLNIPVVSGKRPLDEQIINEMRIGLDKLNDCYVKISAACASGEVDKTVSDGISDEYVKGWQDAMIEVERQGLNKLRG